MNKIHMKYQIQLFKVDTYIYRWLEQKKLDDRKYGRYILQSIIWIAQYSPLVMIATILFIGFVRWGLLHEQKMILAIPVCIVAGSISRVLSGWIGYLVPRTRPFARFHSEPLIDHAPDYSFPSNHAAGGFALAVSLHYFSVAAGTVFLLWATFLAISRIFVRLHYFSDVVTGALLGIVSAKLSLDLFQFLMSYLT